MLAHGRSDGDTFCNDEGDRIDGDGGGPISREVLARVCREVVAMLQLHDGRLAGNVAVNGRCWWCYDG